MTERSDLLAAIAVTIQDYRLGEISSPTSQHVERWIDQFDTGSQLPMLREMNHVMKNSYLEKSWVMGWLVGLITNIKLVGTNPEQFWRTVNFLSIQKNGSSQKEMLSEFDQILKREIGVQLSDCGTPDGPIMYLDDAIFTAGRAGDDLEEWIRKSPLKRLELNVVVIVSHKLADWQLEKRLLQVAKNAGKSLNMKVWRAVTLENRKMYRNSSEILWPSELPESDELKTYMAAQDKYPFETRSVPTLFSSNFFSSEEGRQLLEKEFLLAGLRIRSFPESVSPAMRPLGFSPFGLGFGSIIMTYRNCPNNCPLALWWGDPDQPTSHPLSKWYPLFPRKTYVDSYGTSGW